MKRILLILFTFGVILYGCGEDVTGPGERRDITARATETHFHKSDTVRIEIFNTRYVDAFFTQCTGSGVLYTVQRRNDDQQWEDYTISPCSGYYERARFQVESKQTFTQRLMINSVGVYRLSFPFSWERGVISDTLYSSLFNVTE
jgi:hypothetical protein